MSTRVNYVVKKGQNLVNVGFERPLLSDGMQSSVSCLVVFDFFSCDCAGTIAVFSTHPFN